MPGRRYEEHETVLQHTELATLDLDIGENMESGTDDDDDDSEEEMPLVSNQKKGAPLGKSNRKKCVGISVFLFAGILIVAGLATQPARASGGLGGGPSGGPATAMSSPAETMQTPPLTMTKESLAEPLAESDGTEPIITIIDKEAPEPAPAPEPEPEPEPDQNRRQLKYPDRQNRFVHLHHMKSGGTSLDGYLRCAKKRAEGMNHSIVQGHISECAWGSIDRCRTKREEQGQKACGLESEMMSYCAPLKVVNEFDWSNASKVTVIRNPVDRAWSMYRYTTKRCYRCIPLKEIYQRYDNGTLAEVCDPKLENSCHGVCIPQLLNHITTNLLSSATIEQLGEEQAQIEAIENLHTAFDVIGLTAELPATTQMLGTKFPWLANELGADVVDENGNPVTNKEKCEITHANKSPSNNPCNPPHEPDEETRNLILSHNKIDFEVYKEALKIHAKQRKELLGEDWTYTLPDYAPEETDA